MSKLAAVARTGAWLGVAAASATVGFAAERYVMGRSLRGQDPHVDEQFGSLRGARRVVMTDDGVPLHVEVDDAKSSRRRQLTVVFTHGYALSQDAWHFQRRALRGRARLVFWDVRGHGRSQPVDGGDVTYKRLAADLGQVMDAVAPEGPVVLVGHSMGGMIVMAHAVDRLETFGDRVVGVGLVATSARGLDRATLGLPGPVGRMAKRAAPGVAAALARRPELVEKGRRAGSDLGYVVTRRYSFAGGGSPSLVEFTAAMNAATPIDVVARFLPLFADVDLGDAFPILSRVPTSVIGAADDLLTPVAHARELAERVAGAEYVEAEDTGHMVLLERPELVNEELLDLVNRAEFRS